MPLEDSHAVSDYHIHMITLSDNKNGIFQLLSRQTKTWGMGLDVMIYFVLMSESIFFRFYPEFLGVLEV